MKNETLTDWLFRPFKFIAGGKALVLGIAVMAIVSVLGYFSNIHFSGALDIKMGGPAPYFVHACYQAVTWIVLTLTLYITAVFISKSGVRIIDMAGTVALSQAPLILAALWGFLPVAHIDMGDIRSLQLDELMLELKDNMAFLILNAFVLFIPVVWKIILLYNAYTISANLKGSKAIGMFILALFIAEILSLVALYMTFAIVTD